MEDSKQRVAESDVEAQSVESYRDQAGRIGKGRNRRDGMAASRAVCHVAR
jgi:hypothetical protein